MIFVPILALFHLFLEALIALLPNSTGFSAAFQTDLTNLFHSAYAWNGIFPIDTLLQVLGLMVAFELAVFGYKLVRWIISVVRGTNLKGTT